MSTTSDTLKENDIIFKQGESPNNDFLFKYGIDHGFWLNDLYFEVPPERIVCQEENNYADFQALRSTGSAKIPVGIATEIFVISFNITSKASIINVDTRNNLNSANNTGKRGGLFDLIVQFKHVPISVIENAYLRAKLKVPSTHNMVFCLHNLAISTSPGEPGTLVGQLTISPMAYTCYSDKWLYKKYWRSKTGFYFEDLNPIELENRIPYNLDVEKDLREALFQSWMQQMETIKVANESGPAMQAMLRMNSEYSLSHKDSQRPFVLNDKIFSDKQDEGQADQSIVNPMYQTVDSLNQIDLQYMNSFEVTRYARESEPFKAYIDWIHYLYKDRTVNNKLENNKFDFTLITNYGSRNINDYYGNNIKLKWNTFRKIAIDPDVADTIRLYIKRKIAMFRYELFENAANAINFLDNPNEAVQQLGSSGNGESNSGSDVPENVPKLTKEEIDSRCTMRIYLATIAWMESGGNWNQVAGSNGIQSSAFGAFQFLSSSWGGKDRKSFTNLPQGANEKNVTIGTDKNGNRVHRLWSMNGGMVGRLGMAGKWTMADRADPEKSTIGALALANLTIKALRAEGLCTLEPTTASNLEQTGKYSEIYLGHFLGSGGVTTFLKAYTKNKSLPWNQALNETDWQGPANSNLTIFWEGERIDQTKAITLKNFRKIRPKTMEEVYNRMVERFYDIAARVLAINSSLQQADMTPVEVNSAAGAF